MSFADEWESKYGDPLESFRAIAALASVQQVRLRRGVRERIDDYEWLVRKQEMERRKFLDESVPGSSLSLFEYWRTLETAKREKGLPGWMDPDWEEFRAVYSRQEEETERAIDDLLLIKGNSNQNLWTGDTDAVRDVSSDDLFFGYAINELADCTREGSSSGEACWADVRRALAWFGHDLRGVPNNNLRQKEHRFLQFLRRWQAEHSG